MKIVAERAGRLSSFLKGELKMSTGLVNRLKWQNKILVNGTPQHNDYLSRNSSYACHLMHSTLPSMASGASHRELDAP